MLNDVNHFCINSVIIVALIHLFYFIFYLSKITKSNFTNRKLLSEENLQDNSEDNEFNDDSSQSYLSDMSAGIQRELSTPIIDNCAYGTKKLQLNTQVRVDFALNCGLQLPREPYWSTRLLQLTGR